MNDYGGDAEAGNVPWGLRNDEAPGHGPSQRETTLSALARQAESVGPRPGKEHGEFLCKRRPEKSAVRTSWFGEGFNRFYACQGFVFSQILHPTVKRKREKFNDNKEAEERPNKKRSITRWKPSQCYQLIRPRIAHFWCLTLWDATSYLINGVRIGIWQVRRCSKN